MSGKANDVRLNANALAVLQEVGRAAIRLCTKWQARPYSKASAPERLNRVRELLLKDPPGVVRSRGESQILTILSEDLNNPLAIPRSVVPPEA